MPRGAKRTKGKVETARALPRRTRAATAKPASVPAADERLAEAPAQQEATSEILRVIRRSPGDAQPVFDMIAERAMRLCGALHGGVMRFDGRLLEVAAYTPVSPAFDEALRRTYPMAPGRGTAAARAVLTRAVVQIPDITRDRAYELTDSMGAAGFRSALAVPMLRDGAAIGVIVVFRTEVGRFPERQVALLQTFADQAVIAVENARLVEALGGRNRELTETLERQTATGEILRAISASPTDVQPVFEAIVRSAARLCEAEFSAVARLEDGMLHLAAMSNMSPAETRAYDSLFPRPPRRDFVIGRAFLEGRPVHVEDVLTDPEYDRRTLDVLQTAATYRSYLGIPIVRNGTVIGAIGCGRRQMRPFTASQIELVKTFADQAVIAIENVRLFRELEVRNRALTESLDQQTATSDILRVISSSPTDVQPVFAAVAESAARLCEAVDAAIWRREPDQLLLVAHHGAIRLGSIGEFSIPLVHATAAGRSVLDGRTVHLADAQTEAHEFHETSENARRMAFRTILCVPLLREGVAIGAIQLRRAENQPFADRQVTLLQTFADQAVIAIENVRLFTQVQEQNRELTETVEQQTATSEILRAISASPTDVHPVFDMIARNARRLCAADSGAVFTYDGELIHLEALDNVGYAGADALRQAYPQPVTPGHATGRAILQGRPVHIEDAQADRDFNLTRVLGAGVRTVLAVPMMREGAAVGVIVLHTWSSPRPFSEGQIALLETFADQAVIAIQNVRLFQELEARNRDLTETLEQQTATGEILRVISSTPTDVQPVFDTIAENAMRLCEGQTCQVFRFEDGQLHFVASRGRSGVALETARRAFPRPADPGSAAGRAILDAAVAHIPDVHADSCYDLGSVARAMDFRAIVAVPMLREGRAVGAIAVARAEPGRFPDRQIDLLKTFADQAVIAIENVRLFQELETRTGALTRSVGELRALGEVSQAVGSTLDLHAVLETIVDRAVRLSGSDQGVIYEFDDASQTFHQRATHGMTAEYLQVMETAPIRVGEGAIGRAAITRQPVEVVDIQKDLQLVAAQAREQLIRQGMGSLLAVPLVREDRILGGLVIIRRQRGAFSPEVVAMLQTFATQSVLAIHNARLFLEIQRQKQYADSLVETSPVAIVTMNLDGAVIGWNPGAERLFGYPPAEALGHHMEELIATPELRDEVAANIRDTIAGEWIRAIGRRARKDGTMVDVEISSMPVLVDGAKVGMIGIYHDITELLRARQEAETANEAKSAFLATMSHEIRTPMNAVIGMSGLLLNTRLSDEQRDYAEVIRQSGDTLLTVINDILDFSKIEAGKLELEAQPFDVRECVEGALDLVATRAAEKGLDLAYLVGDGVPAGVVGDVTRLRQVLLNLLSNAVKFTEHGEVVLSVGARPPARPGAPHELTFAVRDTGIGIPADRLDRLFQSFSQVDASTTRRYGGTGLGLAISQRLTELMGGRIDVTSELGVGSEFRFTIRAHPAEVPVPIHRDLSGVQPSLRGKRVLVVDDNATNRRIVTVHLDTWGMPARATESPLEALEWLRAGERFDVAILDMHMPEMDGVTLAHALRPLPAGASLPLILFTSLGRREARAEDEGFAAYLHKPIKPSQLFDALVSVLADQPIHVAARGATGRELDPDLAERHPLRILLAEDNVVNQKVALRLLAQMGYRADVAANGLEAIEAVARQTYDVVLMDVQMPELDGFEASREINRRWPGGQRPRIVAMTANAMQGDRELCVAAGMDDYVAKPIRVEELVGALGRVPSHRAAATSTAAAAGSDGTAPATTGAGGEIDRAVLDRLVATTGGPFVSELIDTFGEDARDLLAALRRTLVAQDVDGFRRAAHSLKSTAESLGATTLGALARELEAQARAGSLEGAAERLDRLDHHYARAAAALGDLRRDLSA
jgi:PAS domain S-box-containing protein